MRASIAFARLAVPLYDSGCWRLRAARSCGLWTQQVAALRGAAGRMSARALAHCFMWRAYARARAAAMLAEGCLGPC